MCTWLYSLLRVLFHIPRDISFFALLSEINDVEFEDCLCLNLFIHTSCIYLFHFVK